MATAARSHPLPVAIRCQAVDGAGENLHRLATGGYGLATGGYGLATGGYGLATGGYVLATGGYGLPVAIRCQAVDGAMRKPPWNS